MIYPHTLYGDLLFVGMCVPSHVQLFASPWVRPPGFSAHGISLARIVEWLSMSSSRGFSQCKDHTYPLSPALAGKILYHCEIWEACDLLIRREIIIYLFKECVEW